ncbi:hypothetical protein GGQ73_003060 [Rhizobium skierniewicense]|uniref:Uncharacterized protein n=1 Tax=Rhizobium skierniewicense TaxID=984260 RepID=A0A7W6C958_9HYPH|nr:hypothetical protein [Rhizobium skierniewicense]MBB3947096.1 hypothetical protein [Rhizobium skierniewicense]
MTREEARAAWDTSGLTYAHLTASSVQKLRDLIGTKMKSSGLMAPSGRSAGTYRIQSKIKVWLQHGGFGCGLYCKAFYFKDREAVTFNDNGFIGFAGWADEVNVQPILSAFVEWVEGLKTEPANV